jgi:hypothetical protein
MGAGRRPRRQIVSQRFERRDIRRARRDVTRQDRQAVLIRRRAPEPVPPVVHDPPRTPIDPDVRRADMKVRAVQDPDLALR